MTQMRRPGVVLATLLLAVGVLTATACSSPTTSTGGTTGAGASGGGSGANSATVVEQNFQFNPSSLNVAVGATVTFTNKDSATHHVVVGTTDLGDQAPGATVTWTASTAGTFPVKCIIHPSMTGQIVVGGSGGSTAPSAPTSTPPSTGGY